MKAVTKGSQATVTERWTKTSVRRANQYVVKDGLHQSLYRVILYDSYIQNKNMQGNLDERKRSSLIFPVSLNTLFSFSLQGTCLS